VNGAVSYMESLAGISANESTWASTSARLLDEDGAAADDVKSGRSRDRHEDDALFHSDAVTGNMSLGVSGMGTVSVMNNLAVMGTSLTVNGKEVATQEYVDNKVSQAMAYSNSVSAGQVPDAGTDTSVSSTVSVANNTESDNDLTMDRSLSSTRSEPLVDDNEVLRDPEPGLDDPIIPVVGTGTDIPTVADNTTYNSSSGFTEISTYDFEASEYIQEQVMNIELNTSKLTEHSALIQGNTLSILSNTGLIQETRDELYGGLAMSAALSTPELFMQKGLNMTAGTGYYGGRAALSFSANYVTDRVMYSFGYAHAN
ncbi:uncharacterized protein METZ01_LOCUS359743, partial [marine metagenome]